MSYVSLYRRFRPDTFENVVGQDHIVRTLTNQITKGTVSHAYLFTGTRGTGKTTCAKIMARAVNCLSPQNGSPCGVCEVCLALSGESLDIIEMDAASNNGVDEIRELRENAQYRPSVGKYKVYIVDEVHMLSGAAFNALLKTLEEPPAHVIFILATTEAQKLPQTILSRCMRFDFRLVDVDVLTALLKKIFTEIKVTFDEDALKQIALQGEGSVRDTLSLADMCLSYCGGHIGYAETLDILCASNFDTLHLLGGAILDGDTAKALETAESLLKSGRNTVARDLANYFMDILEVKNTKTLNVRGMADDRREKLSEVALRHTNYRIARAMDIMAGMESALRYATQPRIILEANIVRACELITELNVEGLNGRIKELETTLAQIMKNGIAQAPKNAAQTPIANAENTSTAVSQKEETPQRPKNDIEMLLEQMAEKTEETAVFQPEEEQDDYRAMDVWARIQVKLSDNKEHLLLSAAENIESAVFAHKTLTLFTSDKVTLELMRKQHYSKILSDILQAELGAGFSITCEPTPVKESGISQEKRVLLTDLFGNNITFK